MAKAQSTFPKPIYLSASTRSPIGRFGGALKSIPAGQLAALTLKESISRISSTEGYDSGAIDYVLLGHARQAGARPNPARQATLFAGLPESVPAMTLNQACASGLSSVVYAAEKIALKRAKNIFAGGVESMSNTPYYLMNARWGLRLGNQPVVDGMNQDGFHCPMADMLMGATVENFIAKELNVSRQDQDAFALRSQQLAAKAWSEGLFNAEIFSVISEGKEILKTDEHMRPDTTLETLAKLRPVFDQSSGSVTAGNASGITDGAAFMYVSEEKNTMTDVEFLDYEVVGLDPKRMGLGPIEAVRRLLARQKLQVSDIDVFELNEAFAAQVIACQRELKIPLERLNLNGGAIAIGHPIGATGARILVTLNHLLRGKTDALGVATLCVSGGQGIAVLVRGV